MPTKHYRDLSGLRSSTINPFSSLRRRRRNHKNSHHFIKFRSQPNSQYTFPNLYYHNPAPHRPSQPHFPASLNWEDDPRLFELSQALNALGWVRR